VGRTAVNRNSVVAGTASLIVALSAAPFAIATPPALAATRTAAASHVFTAAHASAPAHGVWLAVSPADSPWDGIRLGIRADSPWD